MNAQEEIIKAIKELHGYMDEVWTQVWSVIFYYDLYSKTEKVNFREDIKESLEAAFQGQDRKRLVHIVSKSKELQPFVGNDLYNLFTQFHSLFIALSISLQHELKTEQMRSLSIQADLLREIDEKYRNLAPLGFLNFMNLGKIKNEMDKDFTEMVNVKLESLSKSDFHITGNNPVIGNQNTVGDNNNVNNKAITEISLKTSIRLFKDEHPLIFWVQIVVDVFALFLVLVQLGWIKF